MQHTEIDHLVVVADSLAQGAAWCEATLGAAPSAGSVHPLFGTHNLLLSIASSVYPRSYLEIIAIDPSAAPPGRTRWFGMDDPALQARVRSDGPTLVGYVARSAMVDMHRWGLINTRFQPGPILSACLNAPAGPLRWQIVVADDGKPLAGGAVPTLIQWKEGPHPTDSLQGSGLQLQSLTVRGMPDLAAQVLRIRPLSRAALPGAALSADLVTSRGDNVTLSTTA